ncbi:hypothetical protein I4U23_004705 [Adineta vaga]|nr:hypothetical protein I4U23_004705 [Adineta vaga]
MSKKKTCINLTSLGHAESGKSTTAGHLIWYGGGLDKRTLEKFERRSAEMGKGSSKYACLMNTSKMERERGIGTLLYPLLDRFETNTHQVIITDESGERNFIKNIVVGYTQIDCTLIVVSASPNEFEVGISTEGQTLDHVRLSYISGIKQTIVIVNKMDATVPPFSEMRFNQIKSELSTYLANIGYQSEMIPFIPLSALDGNNIFETSQHMPWYQGWSIARRDGNVTGKTLLEAIDTIIPSQNSMEKPLRLPIQDVYKIAGVGAVSVGRVETGILKQNMSVNIAPVNLTGIVSSIEMHHEALDEGRPGDNLGFNIRGIGFRELRRGFVCSDATNDPAREAVSFTAQIIVLHHPNQICQGYTPVIDCHTAHVACRFVELISKICRRTGKVTEETPKYIKSGESGIVKLIPIKPVCVEKFSDYPALGRFAVRDLKQTVAVGIIIDVEKAEFVRIPVSERTRSATNKTDEK